MVDVRKRPQYGVRKQGGGVRFVRTEIRGGEADEEVLAEVGVHAQVGEPRGPHDAPRSCAVAASPAGADADVGAGVRGAGAVPEARLPALLQREAPVHGAPLGVGHLGVAHRDEAVGAVAAVQRRGPHAPVPAVPQRPRRGGLRGEAVEAGADGHVVGVAHAVGPARRHRVALVLGRVPVQVPRLGRLHPRRALQQAVVARAHDAQVRDDRRVVHLEAVGYFLRTVYEAEGEAGVGGGVRHAGELDAVPGPGAPDFLAAVPDEHLGVAVGVHHHGDGARGGVRRALPRRQRPVLLLHVVDPHLHLREHRVRRVVEPFPRHGAADAVGQHQVAVVEDLGGRGRQLGRRLDGPNDGLVPRGNGERAAGGDGERGARVVPDGARDRGLAVGDPHDGAEGDLVVPHAEVGAVGARRGEEAQREVALAARDQRLVGRQRGARRDGVPCGCGMAGRKVAE